MPDAMKMLASEAAKFEHFRQGYEAMAATIVHLREGVTRNSQQDPAAAAHLINLYDQQLALLAEMVTSCNRVIAIFRDPDSSDEPVEELHTMMDAITTNQKVMTHLMNESSKIAPGAKIRGEGRIQ